MSEVLENIKFQDELPVTHAVLHRLLSDDAINSMIIPNKKIRDRKLQFLELSLIEHYNSAGFCWGWLNDDNVKNTGIDNALYVMNSIHYHKIREEELKMQYESVVNYLLEDALIDLNSEMSALPFKKGGEPDLGITIFMLSVLKKINYHWKDSSKLKKVLNFLKAAESVKKYSGQFSFPWHLSAIIRLLHNADPKSHRQAQQ